jgi:hypothetical protein
MTTEPEIQSGEMASTVQVRQLFSLNLFGKSNTYRLLCGPNNENMLGVIFLNADGLSDCLQLKMPILESEIYSKSIFSNEAFGAKVSGFKKRRISPVANFAPQLHP